MSKTTRRLLIGYPIFCAGIVSTAMLPPEMEYSRYEVGCFIMACCFGAWIISAIVLVRK